MFPSLIERGGAAETSTSGMHERSAREERMRGILTRGAHGRMLPPAKP